MWPSVCRGQTVAVVVEAVEVEGLAGEDVFTVTAGAVPIAVVGGDPIGVSAGDRLLLAGPGGAVVYEPGPSADSGAFVVAGTERVSFRQLEAATVLPGFGPVVIGGTSGADVITVIARDSSTHAGADGLQDFTTTVNAGVEILWLDVASVAVQAGSGDDQMVLLAPAPNAAVWNVAVSVDGGAPSGGSDLVVVGTPGSTDTVLYQPTGSSAGVLTLVNLASVVGITGVERVVYDGEAGGDSLTVLGTGSDDVILHRPGVQADAGQVDVNSLLPLAYEDLGAGGVVSIDAAAGADLLVAEGTAWADRFVVAGADPAGEPAAAGAGGGGDMAAGWWRR